jgi:hypothetical protein
MRQVGLDRPRLMKRRLAISGFDKPSTAMCRVYDRIRDEQ